MREMQIMIVVEGTPTFGNLVVIPDLTLAIVVSAEHSKVTGKPLTGLEDEIVKDTMMLKWNTTVQVWSRGL